MDDVFVYLVDLPSHVQEMVVPCVDGFTIYIDSKLDEACRFDAYIHALYHIRNGDFEKSDADSIEQDAHSHEKGLKGDPP